MLTLTKIFHFEMAHAIYGYSGACKDIHGHSYELHLTVSSSNKGIDFLPSPGFIIDFKEIKQAVLSSVIQLLDHKLVLSKDYVNKNPAIQAQANLVIWNAEPTAENLLLYIRNRISENLSNQVQLAKLKLYETKDSYAEWADHTKFQNR